MSGDFPPAAGGFGVGSQVAGYRLEEQIGRGGMAVVFRALDERLDRQVALKILAPALASDEAFRQRFIGESRAAAAVDDPHIIPVFEAGEVAGVLFIAMRYVRGGDVRSLVESAGPLSRHRAAEITDQVASALDAAHARGLVHRDVKPANMLLDASSGGGRPDHVYLSDFGLSKMSLAPSGLTGTGQSLGTLDYVAPEQIEGQPVDGRADQYALACAAFELLCGDPPYLRDEGMAVMYAKLSEPPPRLTAKRPDLPAAVDGVFAKALARRPADRFASCREFAAALRHVLGVRRYDSESVSQVSMPPTPTQFVEPVRSPAMPPGGPGVVPAGSGNVPSADMPTVGRHASGQPPAGQAAPRPSAQEQPAPWQAPPGQVAPGQVGPGQVGPGQPPPVAPYPVPPAQVTQARTRRGGRPPVIQTVGLTGPDDWPGGSGGYGGGPGGRPRRRLPLVLAAVLVILAGAGGGAYYLLGEHGKSTGHPGHAASSSGPAGPPAIVVGLPGCSATAATAPKLTNVRTQLTSIGANPFGLAVTADGRYVFAATPLAVMVFAKGPGLAITKPAVAVYPVAGGGAKDEIFTHNGRYLLVAAGNGIMVIDVAAAERGQASAVLGTLQTQGIPVGKGGAIGVAVSADDRFAFVTMQYLGEMSVFNLAQALRTTFSRPSFVGTAQLGDNPVGLTMSPDGSWLYAMNSHVSSGSATGSIAVISVRTAETDPGHSVVSTAPAGCQPARAIVSADGSTLWVTAKASNYLLAFNAARLRTDPGRALIAKVAVGQTPIGLAFADGGRLIVVADTDANTQPPTANNLAVVKTQQALARRPALVGYITSAQWPRELALVPGTQTMLVAENDSDQIQSVDLTSLP